MSADVIQRARTAIEEALPGCTCRVTGGGGHYSIEVTSEHFEGKGKLQRQRMVYAAISGLMSGNDAPLHAVDHLVTETP